MIRLIRDSRVPTPAALAVALVSCLLTSACNSGTNRSSLSPTGTPAGTLSPGGRSNPMDGCPETTLSVRVPELKTSPTAAVAVLSGRPSAQTLGVWIGDYSHPETPTTFDQAQTATPVGHARVLLELVSLMGKPLNSGVSAPAAATRGAAYRATMVIQTHDKTHGAYLNVHGQATITLDTPSLICGTFTIGDADEQAQGTFKVTSGS